MSFLRDKLKSSPIYARVAPFVIFLGLTFFQGLTGSHGEFWIYLVKTLVGAWLVWEMRPFVLEMRWAWSWEALAVGVAVVVMWVGLDNFYPKLSKSGIPWNPHVAFGHNSGLAWMFVMVRLVGSSLVVPPLDEVFY
ncbi:MAG: hypothetical protein ACREIC_34410, partial [Limisphaerales bacterium]